MWPPPGPQGHSQGGIARVLVVAGRGGAGPQGGARRAPGLDYSPRELCSQADLLLTMLPWPSNSSSSNNGLLPVGNSNSRPPWQPPPSSSRRRRLSCR